MDKKIKEFSARSFHWDSCNMRIDLKKSIFFYLRGITVHLGHPKFGKQNNGVIFLQISSTDDMKEKIKRRVVALTLEKKIFHCADIGLNGLIRFDFRFKRSKNRVRYCTGIKELQILLKTFGINIKEVDSRCFDVEDVPYLDDGTRTQSLKDFLENKYVLHK